MAPGWKDIVLRVKHRISRDRLSIIAAGVAFYALLALFPALIAMVALYGLFFDAQQVETHVASLTGMLPQEAADILLTQLRELTQTSTGALGFGAAIGLLMALWSASAGVRTLMEALNVAYGEEEKRGFLAFYGTAILLTLAAIAGAILAIATVIALPIVVKFLGLGSLVEVLISLARWPILLLAMMIGLAVMYRFGPSREAAKWRWVSAGALVATGLWLVGSVLFSVYVSNFASYNETYGSVGAVVVLLTWFLLTSYAVLIGAEVNAETERLAPR
jgi:membrane protein